MNSEIYDFLNSGCILSAGSADDLWLGWGTPIRGARSSSQGLSVYAPDFHLKESQPWWIFPAFRKVERSELVQALSSLSSFPPSLDWIEPEFGFFRTVFEDLQNQFHAGRLKKAVPVVFEKASLQLESSHRAYLLLKMLMNTRKVPVHLYGIWNSQEGILGATPEILFRQSSEGILHTAALAGTRFKNSSHLPLLQDPKEMEEHRIVIDGICSSLGALGQVLVGETIELVLPTLSHLLTPISLQFHPSLQKENANCTFEEVVTRLHPTPALGAFPREEGMLWLQSFQERLDRMRMGAPFGWVRENGESHCVVSIRNVQWKQSTLFLGAGCGVISASLLEREWREILGKIQSIKKIFGLEVV